MTIEENHKGEPCILDNKKLCQEGYCEECELWLKWDRLLKEVQNENR